MLRYVSRKVTVSVQRTALSHYRPKGASFDVTSDGIALSYSIGNQMSILAFASSSHLNKLRMCSRNNDL